MRLLNVACGLAAAILLSGCGGGSPSSSASTPAAAGSTSSSVSTPTGSSSGSTSGSTSGSSSGSGSGSGTGTSTPATGDASLSWKAPTTNTDGSALTNLAGYYIHYGTNSSNLSQQVDISNPGALQYVVTGLGAGTWYFAITSYTNDGEESALSSVVSKTIT